MSAMLPNECAPTKLADAVGKVKDHMKQILLWNWMIWPSLFMILSGGTTPTNYLIHSP